MSDRDRRAPVEAERILRGAPNGWNVSEPFYDFSQSIDFEADGTGELEYGYAQATRILVRFRYTIPEPGRLRFEYLDTTHDLYGHMYEPTDATRHHTVTFTLEEGEHSQVLWDITGPFTWPQRYALRFSSEPFPEDAQPREKLLTYYGWPLRDA